MKDKARRRRNLYLMLIIPSVLLLHVLSVVQAAASQQVTRLVIKEARLEIMVLDTGEAIQSALGLVQTFDGYVVRQRQWDEGDDRYARLAVGVDSADFEGLFQALKRLGTVQNELGTGEDVTDQLVDLESRLANLYETQTRMRAFLDQSTNVTETLRVHGELVRVEGQIGEVQGQINFLRDRAAAAIIELSLVPFMATPTPTPTATPTPLPTAVAWQPGETAQVALVELQDTAQDTADFAIYRLIVCGPWLLLLLLFYSVVWFGYGRRHWRWRLPARFRRTSPAEDKEP